MSKAIKYKDTTYGSGNCRSFQGTFVKYQYIPIFLLLCGNLFVVSVEPNAKLDRP